jgi:hypothetical protein
MPRTASLHVGDGERAHESHKTPVTMPRGPFLTYPIGRPLSRVRRRARVIPATTPVATILTEHVSGTCWSCAVWAATEKPAIPSSADRRAFGRFRTASRWRRACVLQRASRERDQLPDFRYRQTTATLDVRGFPFRTAGRPPIDLGWRAAFLDWQRCEVSECVFTLEV